MMSLYEELAAKAAREGNRAARDGARRDLGLVLYGQREELRDLWLAAERCASPKGAPLGALQGEAADELRRAVERLRPFFGERPASPG
jgi:hypothetical protein